MDTYEDVQMSNHTCTTHYFILELLVIFRTLHDSLQELHVETTCARVILHVHVCIMWARLYAIEMQFRKLHHC